MVVILALTLAVGSMFAGAWWIYAREWRGEWRGHELRYVNGLFAERLYIDGVLVANAQSFGKTEARIEAPLPGSPHGERVVGVITATALTLRGSLYVDGAWCGGDRPPGAPEGAVPATGPTPRDPRWSQVAGLLEDARLREALRDAFLATEDADQGQAQAAARRLETLLTEIDHLRTVPRALAADDLVAEVRAAAELARLE